MANRQRAIPTAPGYWSNPFIGTGADADKQGGKPKCKKGAQARPQAIPYFLNTRFDRSENIRSNGLEIISK